MKIAIVGTAYPYRGGIAAFNERLARQFQAEGHEVDLYTFTLQYPNFLFPGKTQYAEGNPPDDLKIFRCINSVNPFNWIKVGRRINSAHYDLVLFAYWMSFFAPCYGTIARRLKKTKRIALVHNMMPHEKSLLDKLFPPFFVRSMDGFVALSESVLKDVVKIDKRQKPKACSPHPIYDQYGAKEPREKALERLGLDPQFRYVLFFGLVRAYKGLDLLIEAAADERLRKYQVKILVAGEFYDPKQLYLDEIEGLGMEDNVVIHDHYIPDDQVKDYFNAADLVAQPYISATQSGVTQIAYHFEKPMLVTNVGGLDEIVPNGKVGYAVDPEMHSIADALVDFFECERSEEFVRNLLVEKEKFSWNKLTNVILNLK
jgi:glycosyltransferase involved in cell wall biosynthesis